jgi:predicted dehydrogenase
MADKTVRMGIVGYGGMGSHHADYLFKKEIANAELAGVADRDPARLEIARGKYGDKVKLFESAEAMFAAKAVDAVIIATPHYDHPPLCIKALQSGIHAMSEKPTGVYTKQVRELNEVAAASDRIFGVMFNQRTRKDHQKMRELVQSGEIGEIRRTMYVITDWLRNQSYYDSGGWRGTWGGEGGGVLMNQAPHNLDLFQWICGMPSQVRAFCQFGRYHNIEVEDDVTAYVRYPNGASGIFITTTGETPGRNFLEITGDRGVVIMEGGKITFRRTLTPVSKHIAECPKGFDKPEIWDVSVPGGGGPEHKGITANFVSAIVNGTPLLASGLEGINGVSLCNAMLLSTWLDETVSIPVDEDLYLEKLQEKIKGSTFKKAETKKKAMEFAGTF